MSKLVAEVIVATLREAVRVNPQQLVMPPYIEAGAVMGMALYSAKAVLAGRGGDVLEMIKENVL